MLATLVWHIISMEKISTFDLNVKEHEQKKEALISFRLMQKSFVTLKILTYEHEEVRLLLKEILAAREHTIQFSFGNLEPGEYIIKLIVNSESMIDIEQINFKIY